MISFNVILFDGFEALDAFGPVEIISKMPETYGLSYFSMNGETVLSSQQICVNTLPFSEIDTSGILLIPGGIGTRALIDNIHGEKIAQDICKHIEYIWSNDKDDDPFAIESEKDRV